jgi:hypothetical protein
MMNLSVTAQGASRINFAVSTSLYEASRPPNYELILGRDLSYAPAAAFRAREERESGGVDSGFAAINTPISPRFRAEVLLRRLA